MLLITKKFEILMCRIQMIVHVCTYLESVGSDTAFAIRIFLQAAVTAIDHIILKSYPPTTLKLC